MGSTHLPACCVGPRGCREGLWAPRLWNVAEISCSEGHHRLVSPPVRAEKAGVRGQNRAGHAPGQHRCFLEGEASSGCRHSQVLWEPEHILILPSSSYGHLDVWAWGGQALTSSISCPELRQVLSPQPEVSKPQGRRHEAPQPCTLHH